jgi:exodeoxyribonuclease-3
VAAVSVDTVLGEFRRPHGGFEFEGRLGEVAVVLDADEAPAAAALAQRVTDYRIVRATAWDTRFSDHAPVVADYSLGN